VTRTVVQLQQALQQMQRAVHVSYGEMDAPHVEDSLDDSSYDQPQRSKRSRTFNGASNGLHQAVHPGFGSSYAPVGPPLPPMPMEAPSLQHQDSFQARILDSCVSALDVDRFF
jgi:hypothetical protein